jgi:hypothetical protein
MDRQYYAFIKGEVAGPYLLDVLKQKRTFGEVPADVLVAIEGTEEWAPLSEVAPVRVSVFGVIWVILVSLGALYLFWATPGGRVLGYFAVLLGVLGAVALIKRLFGEEGWQLILAAFIIIGLLYGCVKKPQKSLYPDEREVGPHGRLW